MIVLKYTPKEENFENLYKSAVPVALWVNGCLDFTLFENLIVDNGEKKLEDIHKDLFEMQPDETGLEASVMMLYDNPYRLPLDEDAYMAVPR
jgi:hypothetical protein